jgi:hypothetical protein
VNDSLLRTKAERLEHELIQAMIDCVRDRPETFMDMLAVSIVLNVTWEKLKLVRWLLSDEPIPDSSPDSTSAPVLN